MALAGKYMLSTLDNRYGSAGLPTVEIADMRKEVEAGNSGIISNLMYDRISSALASGHQAILLLNRRGFNTYVSCPGCGHVMNCENCSISMTYHSANNRLMCHYCGKSIPYTEKCPVCGCNRMKYSGIGTQRAETELQALFRDARILRMDADSTMTRSDYEKHLKDFADGKYDILLGTQMVAKGLDFPKVTVVGVLNADSSMHNTDFRSYERTFSLLTQVVGRSGRGDDCGSAVIQTNEPDSKLISLAAKQDYVSFYESEIMTRKLMIYPPYCDIAAVCFSGMERTYTEDAAKMFLKILSETVTGNFKNIKIITLGPTAAAIPKVNNMYKYKLIIKYKNSVGFRQMLNSVFDKYMQTAFCKKISAFIDVNPDSII
jgi:primosomal protein N' (replication factor Y)